jgi:hypothetical protein
MPYKSPEINFLHAGCKHYYTDQEITKNCDMN